MAGYKAPDFTERVAAARAAKQRALDKLRDRPAPDAAVVAERKATREARDALAAARREVRQSELAEAKAAKLAAKAKNTAVSDTLVPGPQGSSPSAAELKVERDARYAARKAKKR